MNNSVSHLQKNTIGGFDNNLVNNYSDHSGDSSMQDV